MKREIKTILAIAGLGTCAALVGCGNDGDYQEIESSQVKAPLAEPVPTPGQGVKMGTTGTDGGSAGAASANK